MVGHVLESIQNSLNYSISLANSLLYEKPDFEPNSASITIRIACLSCSIFILYKACYSIKRDSDRYERIYNNISNASTFKGIFMVAFVAAGFLFGPSSVLKYLWSM